MMDRKTMEQLINFRKKRGWEKYHTPQQLAEAVVIESAELLKCFIWGKQFDTLEVADEVADILIFLAYLCHDLSIDQDHAVKCKIMQNGLKYPEGVCHEW